MKYLLSLAAVLLLSACTFRMQPLYQAKPELPAVPPISKLGKRDVPEVSRETVSISLQKNGFLPSEDNYVNRKNAWVNYDASKVPSVVIGVPDEVVQIKSKRAITQEVLHEELFKTDGYFHIVEQITEKALLRKGFNVIDRSKFEAKLRDLRDKSSDPDYHSTQDRINRELMEVAKQRYNKGEISTEEYQAELSAIESRGGKKRDKDDKEMVDVSELIRAAQSEGIQADYILQINQASISSKNQKEVVNLRNYDDFKDFILKNPEIQVTNRGGQHSLPMIVEIPVYKTEYNAKLINVKTGSIDWLGSHSINSTGVEAYRIDLDVVKTVNNEKAINGSIELYNRKIDSLLNEIDAKQRRLGLLYEESMADKEFVSSQLRDQFVARLKREIEENEALLAKEIAGLKSIQMNVPKEAQAEFHYDYEIQGPYVSPNFGQGSAGNSLELERIKQHRDDLLRVTIQSLLETINKDMKL